MFCSCCITRSLPFQLCCFVFTECSSFSPPTTVILLILLCFEALLFLIFTSVMFGTQVHSICTDETVGDSHALSFTLSLSPFVETVKGYRVLPHCMGSSCTLPFEERPNVINWASTVLDCVLWRLMWEVVSTYVLAGMLCWQYLW